MSEQDIGGNDFIWVGEGDFSIPIAADPVPPAMEALNAAEVALRERLNEELARIDGLRQTLLAIEHTP